MIVNFDKCLLKDFDLSPDQLVLAGEEPLCAMIKELFVISEIKM